MCSVLTTLSFSFTCGGGFVCFTGGGVCFGGGVGGGGVGVGGGGVGAMTLIFFVTDTFSTSVDFCDCALRPKKGNVIA